MTLAKLIERLNQIAAERPEQLEKEVICRTTEKVPDKRTRSGYKSVDSWTKIEYGCSGTISFGEGEQFVELKGYPLKGN